MQTRPTKYNANLFMLLLYFKPKLI